MQSRLAQADKARGDNIIHRPKNAPPRKNLDGRLRLDTLVFLKSLLERNPVNSTRHLFAAIPAIALSPFSVYPSANIELPPFAYEFLENHCLDCHDPLEQKGDFNLEDLTFDLSDPQIFEQWVLVHDRADHGEMPPKKQRRPESDDLERFLQAIAEPMVKADQKRVAASGRAKVRRLNRYEYENTLKHLLKAPWLQLADRLPEDGTAHLYNKIGDRLDVSHVQMTKYLETAEHALRLAMNTAAHPTTTKKYYARDEPVMRNYLKYRPGQNAATRASIPLLGLTPQTDVIRGFEPVTVGDSNPAIRELEAFGFVSGTYTATTKYDFTNVEIPIDGTYKLRVKSYTFMAGPNGRRGGDDHGLTSGDPAWWRPDRNVAFPGKRGEPITLYALADSGDSRWLTTYNAHPDPQVVERIVELKAGENIRPDAGRLVRTRPGWDGNPNATDEGVPGFALNWLEVEGPLHDQWPPASYQALFGDLPFEDCGDGVIKVIADGPEKVARERLVSFTERAFRRPLRGSKEIEPFLDIYHRATELGADFTDAMVAAFASVLCSTDFLYLESQPGRLQNHEIASRLSYFLWNGPPDEVLLGARSLNKPSQLIEQAERLLSDSKSQRFRHAFLDCWLDLREINANTPDAELYPDYYLDDQLTEASLLETRRFFDELLDQDLPIRNLIDSDFTFVNERLARHYGFEPFEDVELQKVEIPKDSPRGGLLTQASILRVTGNGTTTSPVIRGAWIMERIMGLHIPPPPSGVEAVEPDTRGATTIREQLALHREHESCNSCHAKFDPAGLALESFDIAGGWRNRYRANGDIGEPAEGLGKNGHAFAFRYAEPVDPSGEMQDGTPFQDIEDFKRILLEDERAIARNFAKQLIVYATGAPVTFSDRAALEEILDRSSQSGYGARTILKEVVQSDLFRIK